MNELESLFYKYGESLLDADERFEAVARLYSGSWSQKHFIAGATGKRIILVEVSGATFGPRPDFVAVRNIPYREVDSLTTSAFLNQKRIFISLRSGGTLNLGLNSLLRTVPGQAHFIGALRSRYEDFKLNSISASESGDESEGVSDLDLKAAREEARQHQRLGMGILAGAFAAVLAAIIWAGITLAMGYQIGWMAIGVGVLVGSAIRFVGRGVDRSFGVAGALLALFGCIFGNVLWAAHIFAQAVQVPLTDALAILVREPSLAFELMLGTFDLSDLTFYTLAAFSGYALAIRNVRPLR